MAEVLVFILGFALAFGLLVILIAAAIRIAIIGEPDEDGEGE